MQLIGRVLLLALCVFSVYSLPNTINVARNGPSAEKVLSEIENFIHSHFGGSSNSTNNNSTNTGNNTINNGTNSNNNSTNNVNPCVFGHKPNKNCTNNNNNSTNNNNNSTNNNNNSTNNNNNCNFGNNTINGNNNCTNNNNNSTNNNNNSTNNNSTNNNNNNSTSDITVALAQCYKNYTIEQDTINQSTINNTQLCYNLNETSVNTTHHVCAAAVVRARSSSLEKRLADCSAKDHKLLTFSCYVETFDKDLKQLDQIRKESGLCLPVVNDNLTKLQRAQRDCAGTVVADSKTKSIAALNTLESCLFSANQNTTVPAQDPLIEN